MAVENPNVSTTESSGISPGSSVGPQTLENKSETVEQASYPTHPPLTMDGPYHLGIKQEEVADEKTVIWPPQKATEEVVFDNVQSFFKVSSLEVLERGVSLAHKILDELQASIIDAEQEKDQLDWLSKIQKLKETSPKADNTMVAVVGMTGSGKSSLINALLDQEELLPTDGSRACTAVATEICYNEDSDPAKAFRAEIDFLSREEWDAQLNDLLGNLVDDSQEDAPSWEDPLSDAGIAYAKIQAVFPELTHGSLMKTTPEQLAERNPAVSKVLGTTRTIIRETARELSVELTKYISSKNEGAISGPKRDKIPVTYWPLIKVVRIYCKSHCLSTGAVLVDLPGNGDSNAARSAVANDYLGKCNQVCIVAKVQRAADDKSSKDLLERSFRAQLLMDGHFSHLSFIATQTDDINVRESINSFDLDGQIQGMLARKGDVDNDIRDQETVIRGLEQDIQKYNQARESIKKQRTTWKDHARVQKTGRTAYMKEQAECIPAKRKRSLRDTGDEESDDSDSDSDHGGQKRPLTVEEVSAKLEELKGLMDTNATERLGVRNKHEIAKSQLIDLQNEKANLAVESVRTCIQRRNAKCKDAIKNGLSMGIKEFVKDDEDDQPDLEFLTKKCGFEKVIHALPVFCVSSKAYKQLNGMSSVHEIQAQGFKTLEDTEVPALQKHIIDLTLTSQIMAHKTYLNRFIDLLHSLAILTAACSITDGMAMEGNIARISEQEQKCEDENLETEIRDLYTKTSNEAGRLKKDIQNAVRRVVTYKNSKPITAATDAVDEVVKRWGQALPQGGYGIAYMTYKTICKRNGEKTPNKRARNFNQDLSELYTNAIADSWDTIFACNIPGLLDKFLPMFRGEIEAFHNKMASRPVLQKSRMASLKLLEKHLEDHESFIGITLSKAKDMIQTEQRHANRTFCPNMKEEMINSRVYEKCANMKGRGCFKKIKNHMETHIRTSKKNLYAKVARKVTQKLENQYQIFESHLVDDIKSIVRGSMKEHYSMMINAGETMEATAIALGRCHAVLAKVDSQFKAILDSADLTSKSEFEPATSTPDDHAEGI